MINRYLKIVAVLLLMIYTAFANAEIGIYDLRYTLNTDLNTKEGLDVAWDDVHAVSTLQGVVNRDAPRLYVYFVMEGNHDIDGINIVRKVNGCMDVRHGHTRQWRIYSRHMLLI